MDGKESGLARSIDRTMDGKESGLARSIEGRLQWF